MSRQPLITKQDVPYLKGIAILLIAFHNFLHLLPPNYGCNEFNFKYSRVIALMQGFTLSDAVNSLFAFFGYAGVYVFFFLSGYGLTKQMMTGNKDNYYALKRIKKLWGLLFIGVIWYVVLSAGRVDYMIIFRKLTMTDNFFWERASLISKPWWFICCLAQLYVLFVPLYKFICHRERHFFMVLYLYVITAYLWLGSAFRPHYLYLNFAGHLPEFCLGIYLACYENKLGWLYQKKFLWLVAALGLIILLMAQLSRWVWVFNGLSVLLFLLPLYKLVKIKVLAKAVYYVGKISPYLYIIHGITFRRFFVGAAKYDTPLYQLLWALFWFVIVVMTATVLDVVLKQIKLLFRKVYVRYSA